MRIQTLTIQHEVYVVRAAGRRYLQLRWRDAKGRMRQQSARTTQHRQAERMAVRKAHQLNAEAALAGISWETIRKRFTREHVHHVDRRTKAAYRTAMNRFEDTVPFNFAYEITDDLLAQFVEQCETDGLSPSSIRTYLRHLQTVWRCMVRWGMLAAVPHCRAPKVDRAARGRPLTGEEFERILAAIGAALPSRLVAAWQWDARLLWLTGLRIGDAHQLSWPGDHSRIQIHGIDRRRPMVWFPAGRDKSRRESSTPLTPDAIELLRTEQNRDGYVFRFLGHKGRRLTREDTISKRFASFGKAAGVVTGFDHNDQPRYATAHDMRRSFGCRWAPRVSAAVLQKMMRHASIQTTMTYYADIAAVSIADAVHEAASHNTKRSEGDGHTYYSDSGQLS